MSRRPRRREEITPLNGMRRICTQYKTAKAKNTLLRQAYIRLQLPHTGSATLTAFGAAEEREPAEGRHTDDSEFEMLT